MLKFVDRNHTPAVPKSYRFSRGSVPWNEREPWTMFYERVVSFANANNLSVPSENTVEDALCRQISKGWCVDTSKVQPSRVNENRPKGRCKTCGNRHR